MIVTDMHRIITKKDMTDIITAIKNEVPYFPGTFRFGDLVEVVSGLGLMLRGKLFLFAADSIVIGSKVTAADDDEAEVENILTLAVETVISCDCLLTSFVRRDDVECG